MSRPGEDAACCAMQCRCCQEKKAWASTEETQTSFPFEMDSDSRILRRGSENEIRQLLRAVVVVGEVPQIVDLVGDVRATAEVRGAAILRSGCEIVRTGC